MSKALTTKFVTINLKFQMEGKTMAHAALLAQDVVREAKLRVMSAKPEVVVTEAGYRVTRGKRPLRVYRRKRRGGRETPASNPGAPN